MRNTRSIPIALAVLLPVVSNVAARPQLEQFAHFVRLDELRAAHSVVIETDMRLGAENRGQERRIKNEIERLLGDWGRYEVVKDREDADLTITIATNDQINFFQGVYEPLQEYTEFHTVFFVIANKAGDQLLWADGTTDSFNSRTVSGNLRRGWDNEGGREIARRFVDALRERVDVEG